MDHIDSLYWDTQVKASKHAIPEEEYLKLRIREEGKGANGFQKKAIREKVISEMQDLYAHVKSTFSDTQIEDSEEEELTSEEENKLPLILTEEGLKKILP